MKIEVRELMSENEMLSHVFLGCVPREKLLKIKDKYIGSIDWKSESVKIPVEMKIGGVSVNPKEFFDEWKNQMEIIILKKAQVLVSEKMGSQKMVEIQNKVCELEQILSCWEKEINWDVKNPFLSENKEL